MTYKQFSYFLFLIILLANLSAVPATAAQRKSILFDCTMKSGKKGGDWIAQSYHFTIQRNGTAFVFDPITLRWNDDPTPITVNKDGDTVHIAWGIELKREYFKNVQSIPKNGAILKYTAKVNINSGDIRLSATAEKSKKARYKGSGTCIFKSLAD